MSPENFSRSGAETGTMQTNARGSRKKRRRGFRVVLDGYPSIYVHPQQTPTSNLKKKKGRSIRCSSSSSPLQEHAQSDPVRSKRQKNANVGRLPRSQRGPSPSEVSGSTNNDSGIECVLPPGPADAHIYTEEVQVGTLAVCRALREWASIPHLPAVCVPDSLAIQFGRSPFAKRRRMPPAAAGDSRNVSSNHEASSSSNRVVSDVMQRPHSPADICPPGVPLQDILAWLHTALENNSLPDATVRTERERPISSPGLSFGRFVALPGDVETRILSFLSASEIGRAESVCRGWNGLLRVDRQSAHSVWRMLCTKCFGLTSLPSVPRHQGTWRDIFRRCVLLKTVAARDFVRSFVHCIKPHVERVKRTCNGGYTIRSTALQSTRLTFFVEIQPFWLFPHGNALRGAGLDRLVQRFLDRLGDGWVRVNGMEDTELLRKDAVHHLVKLLGGDETGDSIFECFAAGRSTLMGDIEQQCKVVESFLALFGEGARYFNNGAYHDNTSDGFQLVPKELGVLDSGIVVVGREHLGMLWGVQRDL